MEKLTFLDFIKKLDYQGVEEAFTPRWEYVTYSKESINYYRKETALTVFESEDDLIDRLSSIFADDYAQNSPFLKEHVSTDELLWCETLQGKKLIEYPCILPHPIMEMHGIAIPFYQNIYLVYFDRMDYLEIASVKNYIWNLCIEKTIFKLQSKVRYKLSINIIPATNIKAIMVEDSFGSINNLNDFNLYIQRYHSRKYIVSEGFLNRRIQVDSSINNLPERLLPKVMEIEVLLKDDRKRSRTAKLLHNIYINTDNSISIVPQQNSLIEILERQIDLLKSKIHKDEENFFVAPKELYEILIYFSNNDIKTKYGYIAKVLDSKQTYDIAKKENEIYKKAIEDYLDDWYSDNDNFLLEPDLDIQFSDWFDWSFIVNDKSYVLAYIEKLVGRSK